MSKTIKFLPLIFSVLLSMHLIEYYFFKYAQTVLKLLCVLSVPGPVTSLQVRPSSTIFGLIITWGLPSGGNYPTPVTYRLRYRERPSSGSPGAWSSSVQRTATQRQYTTPVLKPGTRYEVKAWALSSNGPRPPDDTADTQM